jgi:hypothetical protein
MWAIPLVGEIFSSLVADPEILAVIPPGSFMNRVSWHWLNCQCRLSGVTQSITICNPECLHESEWHFYL